MFASVTTATHATTALTEARNEASCVNELARRAGLSQRVNALRVNGTTVVELPQACTLDQLWEKLGFTINPNSEYDNTHIEVTGIYRRLAAALESIERRSFRASGFTFGKSENAIRDFLWESTGGVWGSRHWRVTGRITLGTIRLAVTDAVVSVKSTRGSDNGVEVWTAFRGGPLDAIVSQRVEEVFAVIGARLIAGKGRKALPSGMYCDNLTKAELGRYHDLHPSPVAAFKDDNNNRIILWDDHYGSGYICDSVGWPNLPNPVMVMKLITYAWWGFKLTKHDFGEIPTSQQEDY